MEYELKCSTAEARNYAAELKNAENVYTEVVENLKTAKTQIQNNWEGDTTDINDIITRIDTICVTFDSNIIPSLNKLNAGVNTLADEVDAIAQNTVDNQSNSAGGTTSGGVKATPKEESKPKEEAKPAQQPAAEAKPGFWQYHGNNFKNDWDYSGCDSGLDYIGATVDGLVGTVGSVTNFVVDGTSELLGWLFG